MDPTKPCPVRGSATDRGGAGFIDGCPLRLLLAGSEPERRGAGAAATLILRGPLGCGCAAAIRCSRFTAFACGRSVEEEACRWPIPAWRLCCF